MNTASFRIIRLIAAVVAAAGLAVAAGWLGNVTVLTSLRPGWPSLKFSGAISLVLGAVTLYLVALTRRDSDTARTFLPLTTLGIVLLTVPSVASQILGFDLNIESLFISGASGSISLGGVVGYLAMAVVGLAVFDGPRQSGRYLIGVGVALCVVGGVAMLGYVVKSPALYYQFGQGITNSAAMAQHAAALFALLGIGYILAGLDNKAPTPVGL